MPSEKMALYAEGKARCSNCNEIKPLVEFVKDKKSPTGYRNRCKICLKILSKSIADSQRDLTRERNTRSYIKRKYGISMEEYKRQFIAQGEVCDICKDSIKVAWYNGDGNKSQEAHLDHDHVTGKLRKFLCYRCNVGLGYFRDNPELLQMAASYLSVHREG